MKATVNFKIYDITDWIASNYPIIQEVKAIKQ